MNNAERITALIQGNKPDKVPFFCMGGGGFALVRHRLPLAINYNDSHDRLAILP